MKYLKQYRRLRFIALLPLATLLAGCGSSLARYTPTTDEARSSLEAALNAWREGKPCGPIDAKPPVQVADTAWQAGQQVESFEIGEEKDEGDGTRQFVVAIKMKKPPGEQTVRYFVHGRDPVWVYREEDYKRMINMDNNPAPTSPARQINRRAGRRP